jgi:tRNA-specific adenosine deaminase 3
VSRDTRRSSGHPLRHAVLNVIRRIADYRASASDANDETGGRELPTQSKSDADGPQNGSHYLLTSLTLFTTHEPCIMCSMALLHSRVKEVFYLIPMEKTGGCGGLTCLPKLDGVNHRFGISRWKHQGDSAFDVTGLVLDEAIDV